MTTQQGARQAAARAIASTTSDYNGDMLAMFAAEATIADGQTFNGAFITWLQERLGSSDDSLPGLMQAFAEAESAHNWSSLGQFGLAPTEEEVAIALGADDGVEVTATGDTAHNGTNIGFNTNVVGLFKFDTTIPQGATIVSAKVQFTAHNTATTACGITFWCEDADAPASITAGVATADITTRVKTTASVLWDVANWDSVGERGALQLTPELKDLVQEVVERPGFGGVVAFIVQRASGSSRIVATFDHATLQEPALIVSYTA